MSIYIITVIMNICKFKLEKFFHLNISLIIAEKCYYCKCVTLNSNSAILLTQLTYYQITLFSGMIIQTLTWCFLALHLQVERIIRTSYNVQHQDAMEWVTSREITLHTEGIVEYFFANSIYMKKGALNLVICGMAFWTICSIV